MSDIERIFSEDPLNLTRDDIRAAVAKFREARGQFHVGNVKNAGNRKAMKKTAEEAQEILNNIDLGDLTI